MRIKLSLIICCFFMLGAAMAQKKNALISGRVVDENENPFKGVSVIILGNLNGVSTSDSGTFSIKVPAGKAFALVFSHTSYSSEQRNFILNEGEQEYITIRLVRGAQQLQEVTVVDRRHRKEAGLTVLNPKQAINIPSPIGGVESLIKVITGSNNELTSNYNVRGGNYDENLIYVNDFEIFRPYLVNNAQQEGLSFINPEMTRNVNFYNGGFQARYGDKMSSVLDVQYRKPKKFGGSAYIGLLEQGLHVEGTSRNNKFTYLLGVRNRNNENILSRQETQGYYVPASADFQGVLTYQFNSKLSMELLGNFSKTKFTLVPEESKQNASVYTPYFTSNLGLDIYYSGKGELDQYNTNMVGLSVIQQPRKNLRLKWMASYFGDKEKETQDEIGTYFFGERNFDPNSAAFGLITNPLGAGTYQQFTRDRLNIDLWTLSHKGSLNTGRHYWQWGVSMEKQVVNNKLHEWEYQDSAGYSLPYNPSQLKLFSSLHSTADLNINRFTGYIQDNISWGDSSNFTLQPGVRFNYNDLNNELLVSPRIGFSWTPSGWKRDIIFRGAVGLYQQPPFYRELRDYYGNLNTDLKAQKSWQVTAGMDYSFVGFNRPMRFTADAYYKGMWDVIPYDIDNVRIRYYGANNTKAYATGIEMRLHGELVKDAESWVSLGFMRTRENIKDDYYYNYTLDPATHLPVDSSLQEGGWFRRPTDRLITLGLFFQDYLSTNKNFKVYLNTIYGSNLPYNIPNSVKYRNALTIDPYIRVDIGFSALLLDSDRSKRRSHSPFLGFENIWATLEVFNLIDRANTISYSFIKDFSNSIYAIPNRLTPRLLNFKIIARW